MIIIVIFIVIPNVIVVVYIPEVYLHKILVSFGKRREKKDLTQRRIQNPVKHLIWSVYKAANYFRKTLPLRRLIASQYASVKNSLYIDRKRID